MWKPSNTLKVLGVCLSLLLLLAPTPSAQAQEEPTDDDVFSADPNATYGQLVRDAPVVIDDANQTNRVYLPIFQADDEGLGSENESTEVGAAFTGVWSQPPTCTANVGAAERGFWDDVAGAGVGNESGLLWFVENNVDNESCYSYRGVPNLSSTTYSRLFVRYALNDSAIFSVRLYRLSGGFCNTTLTTFTTALDDNGFHSAIVNLPNGFTICRVYVILTDDPNNSGGLRTSVLIDDIRIYDPINGVIGWVERFSF